jgi:hypothetical protein
MRVLHIVAADRQAGADALATSDVLLATMVSQDPGLVLDELDLAAAAPLAAVREPESRARLAEQLADSPRRDAVALAQRILAADVIVLAVGATTSAGAPGAVSRLLDLLARPDALMVRAEVRRSGRRVRRRMVLVAPPGSAAAGVQDGGPLVREIHDAFRRVDVTEFGVIAGGALGARPAPAIPRSPTAAGRWSRIPDRKAC